MTSPILNLRVAISNVSGNKFAKFIFLLLFYFSMFSTRTIAQPAAPTNVTATPPVIGLGGSSKLNATSAGHKINWYNVITGGTPLATVESGVDYTVTPSTSTTYYAEASGGAVLTLANEFNIACFSVYFDITTKSSPIVIDGFNFISNTGAQCNVQVYSKFGTHQGYETHSSSWIQNGTGTFLTTSDGTFYGHNL